MFDYAYRLVDRATGSLLGNRRVRRIAIALCFLPNVALAFWNPPWFLWAYWHTAPFLLLGFGLLLLDFHDWDDRRQKARTAAKPPAEPTSQS